MRYGALEPSPRSRPVDNRVSLADKVALSRFEDAGRLEKKTSRGGELVQ